MLLLAAVLGLLVAAAQPARAQWGEIVLHSFCPGGNPCTDGSAPWAGLVFDNNGNLYGTTSMGGQNSSGTVFKVTPSGAETMLYNFCSQPNCTDGGWPKTGLVFDNNGNLYGTTSGGGAYGWGTVFKLSPEGEETVLYTFSGYADGKTPDAGLLFDSNGNLYGTTSAGGASGGGTVFKVTPESEETVLYSFTGGADGSGPQAGLIFDNNGNLYGTTAGGGANGYGTVFKVTPEGEETVLYSFCSQLYCPDGAYPWAGLVFDTSGNLYGTTVEGGEYGEFGYGTVFKVTPEGEEAVLYNFFGGASGANPHAGLVLGKDGNLYGTTEDQSVFEITPSGSLTVLYSFTGGADGATPWAGLVFDNKGNLYSTTSAGGVYGGGTVFELTQQGGSVKLKPYSLKFPTQALGTTSAAKSVTVTNAGPTMLVISSITVSANFTISANTCGAQLGVGQSCTVSVIFTPMKLGKLTGTLTFVDNGPGNPQTVGLSGTSVLPATLSPSSASFPKQKVGTTSKPKTFTLTNNQAVTLTNIAISTTGDFAVSATTCGTSLAAKEKCTISVTFTPTQTGTRTGQLSASDSASNSPQTATLKGTGY